MARLEDIDIQSLVSKYLRRQTVNNSLDATADASAEVQSLLESVALSFLLFPQTALSMIMRAKNTLQQIVQADVELVDFLIGCVKDSTNPDDSIVDASDLVDAQTALIELDQIGRVSDDVPSYLRYQAAVKRFLDQQLASSLKRHQRNEFERSGTEARQDLFNAVPAFTSTHQVMSQRLKQLASSAADFTNLDLATLVSTKTLTRVRSSLQQLRTAVEQGAVSKTVLALELLAGAAALSSISGTKGVNDPTVDTGGKIPDGRSIVADSVGNEAVGISSNGPWTLTSFPASFGLIVDPLSLSPTTYSLQLPAPGASGKAYVTSFGGSSAYDIPAGYKLYVRLDGTTLVAVPVTSGPSVSFATVVSDIDAALTPMGGRCIEFYNNSNRFLIYSAVEVVVLDSGPGSVSGSGVYTAPSPSVHDILGFLPNQQSLPIGEFTPESLRDLLAGNISEAVFLVEDNLRLRITSKSSSATSSLQFSGAAEFFGFPTTTIEAQPIGLQLREGSTPVNPADLGIFVGSRVSLAENSSIGTRNMDAPVSAIDETGTVPILLFDTQIPRGSGMSITIIAPIVAAVQDLIRKIAGLVGAFDRDPFELSKVLSPVFSQATPAKTNDALSVLKTIRNKLSDGSTGLLDVLSSVSVRDDRAEFSGLARDILDGLTERGLDRAVGLLSSAQFSSFFSVGRDVASHGARFLLAMNTVVQSDLPQSTVEQDIDDGNRPVGSNPDTDVLPALEPSA